MSVAGVVALLIGLALLSHTPASAQQTPPVAPSNLAATATSSVPATLSLTTDENATCRYSTTPGVAYDSMSATFATTGGTSHSTLVSGLANGGLYSFYVRCQDAAGNTNTTDFAISFSVGSRPADTAPPGRANGQPTGSLPAGTAQTTLSLTTDENATCRYSASPGVAYGSMSATFATTGGTAHATPVSGLVSGSAHAVYVRCEDTAANANTTDFVISFGVGLPSSSGYALRFHGNGTGDIDRVKIRIDGPARPADIGATDFTLEFWMKAIAAANASASCVTGNDGWIQGNIVFDRDIEAGGDFGDFGISLAGGRIAFGVNNGTAGAGLCTTQNVADGVWHHIAVTRSLSTGQLRIFVDGLLDAEGPGPLGDLSYRDGRPTTASNDPFLVIGAEKHDAGPNYPSYSGWIDDVRLSSALRYTAAFPRPSAPFITDPDTVALYHFDEGSGDLIADSSGAPGGPSDGVRRFGGTPQGPEWVTDTPFGTSPDTAAPARFNGHPTGSLPGGSTQVTLTWQDNSGDEIEFRIRRASLGSLPIEIATASNTTTFADTLPAPGTYLYQVRACNAAGCSEYSNEVSVNTSAISLSYGGKLRDRVTPGSQGLGSDGVLDGTLSVTLHASGGRTITRLQLQSSAPGTWDTDAATSAWLLGVATTLDGPLLNDPGTMAVSFTVADGGTFHLFAADFADIEFVPGTTLTVTADFSDGTNARTSIAVPSP